MTIRHCTPNDAADVAAIYRPIVESTTISFELEAPSDAEIRSRIVVNSRQYPWLVAEDCGSIVGYAYASAHRERAAYASSVDVSVYVAEKARARGVGRTLYEALFSCLAEEKKFHRAFAGIALPNEPSIVLHKALNFELVGVYREVGTEIRTLGRRVVVAARNLTGGSAGLA